MTTNETSNVGKLDQLPDFPAPPRPDETTWAVDDRVHKLPTGDEAIHYYHGLPSWPRLVATTSFTFPAQGICPGRKSINTISKRHNINPFWDDRSELYNKILNILKGHNWSAIDIVGIDNTSGISGDTTTSIIMLISVAPDSMQWHMGIWVAAQCKRILDSFGLSDVEVEIKDSNFIRMAETSVPSQESTSNPVQAQQKAPANSHTFFETPVNMARKSWLEEKVQVSKYPGVQIASEAHGTSGTRGTIEHWRTVTVAESAELLEAIHLDEAKAKPGPPQNELLDKRTAFEEVEALSKHLENHKSRQSRRFGHVFFSAKSTVPDGWFRNYALICLNKDAYFGGDLPANTIWAPEMFIDFHRTTRYQVDHDRYIKPRYEVISPATVELTSHLTKDQISEPGECLRGAQFTGEDKDCLVVATVGAETWRGIRLGMVNNAKSVTRHSGRWGESISMEVCVISMSRSGSFAHGSDAGACVWSLDGQILGIVSGGVGSGQADTTYVSMLEDIFADLRKAGIQATIL